MTKKRKARRLTPEKAPLLFPQITHLKKRAFLTKFAQTGQRVKTAKAVHIDLRYHYRWLREDPDYAQAFAEAEIMADDLLEDRLIELGTCGYEEGIYCNHSVTGGKPTAGLPVCY